MKKKSSYSSHQQEQLYSGYDHEGHWKVAPKEDWDQEMSEKFQEGESSGEKGWDAQGQSEESDWQEGTRERSRNRIRSHR